MRTHGCLSVCSLCPRVGRSRRSRHGSNCRGFPRVSSGNDKPGGAMRVPVLLAVVWAACSSLSSRRIVVPEYRPLRGATYLALHRRGAMAADRASRRRHEVDSVAPESRALLAVRALSHACFSHRIRRTVDIRSVVKVSDIPCMFGKSSRREGPAPSAPGPAPDRHRSRPRFEWTRSNRARHGSDRRTTLAEAAPNDAVRVKRDQNGRFRAEVLPLVD